jgi:hypothetical protein
MKQLEMSNFGVLEMEHEEMREVDGGYGYHVSQKAGSDTVGKFFGSVYDGFAEGFTNGYNAVMSGFNF